ncbi:hypothetical protein [uncultured Microbulbifer sp.]|uniref:hypothetical protein n=1 Tax=uncultured Microbulbifer sp. TaxID=348147 RepID=UPI0026341972|nr:hypothetical protein [uncultured Microbulbifer sp.]
MSYEKKDQFIPSQRDEKIRISIARILREGFSETNSAIKIIAKHIHANPRGVKNWYQGTSAPNLSHFISLASMSPALMCWFLRITGYLDLARWLDLKMEGGAPAMKEIEFRFYGVTFDTENIPGGLKVIQSLNHRQMWLYAEVKKENKPTAQSLSSFWGVGIATARRDISHLIRLRLIYFSGARKTGYYAIQKWKAG